MSEDPRVGAEWPKAGDTVWEEERVENLARAMCVALDIDPDEKFSHSPEPDENGIMLAVLLYSPNWKRFAWRAQLWIYENSGGKLP